MRAKVPATKTELRALMRRQLGKVNADALLKKIDTMKRKGASASAVEKATKAFLAKHFQQARTDVDMAIWFYAR